MGGQGLECPNGLASAVCMCPGLEAGLQPRAQGEEQTWEPAEVRALSLATVGPWASHLISQCLSFLLCKMGSQ